MEGSKGFKTAHLLCSMSIAVVLLFLATVFFVAHQKAKVYANAPADAEAIVGPDCDWLDGFLQHNEVPEGLLHDLDQRAIWEWIREHNSEAVITLVSDPNLDIEVPCKVPVYWPKSSGVPAKNGQKP